MAYIFQAHQGAIGAGLDDNVVEFGGFRKPSDRTHAHLIGLSRGQRRLPDLSRRDLHVLLLQRVNNGRSRKAALGQLRRIEPQPHGIFALAKNNDVADPVHALQRILDVDVDVVAQEQAVVLSSLRVHARAKHESAGLLGDDDAGVLYSVWQAA